MLAPAVAIAIGAVPARAGAPAGPPGAAPASVALPDPVRTPGAIASSDARVVCARGYAERMRHRLPRGVRWRVYRAYGIPRSDRAHVIDHRVPLELGGSNDARNLWPQPKREAWRKDGLEDFLHRAVCEQHTMTLPDAQAIFLEPDWHVAWHAYGEPLPPRHWRREHERTP